MFLGKMDDSRTGISDAQATGQADPLDPRAPAAKTAMLLKQSGINIEEYVNCIVPSFNKVGEIILQLTHQMTTSSRRFRSNKRKAVVGSGGQEIYSVITRDEMILETVLESRAAGFAFDKLNEKQENLTLYQLFRDDPILNRNPGSVHELAVTLMKSWSPMWKAKAEKMLLTNEQFDEQTMQVAVQALGLYIQGLEAASEKAGAEVQPKMEDYLKVAMQLMDQSVNPQQEEKK